MKTIIVTTLLILTTILHSFSQNELKNYLVIKSKTTKAWTAIPEGKRIKVVMTNKESHKGTFRLDLDQGELTGIIITGDTLPTNEIKFISYNPSRGNGLSLIGSGVLISSLGLAMVLSLNETESKDSSSPAYDVGCSMLGLGIISITIGSLISLPVKYPQNTWGYTCLQTTIKKNSKEFSKKIKSLSQ